MRLNMKEISQLVTFEKIKDGLLTKTAAAKTLDCSVQWVRKKFKRYLHKGAAGLVHKNRGRPSCRVSNQEHIKFAMELLNGSFCGFGPTFISEKLFELYRIQLSREVLRKAMIKQGLWQAKKRKPKHRERRERKEFFGQMIQLDGSPHDWFEGRGPKCTLLVFIDDATSMILHMELASAETTKNVLLALQSYIQTHGRPCSLYVDFGSVFSVNTNNVERDKQTQFKRACRELDIEIIYARSPQAKGRVERSNKTHQDRLVKELRLAGISTIQEANKFIQEVYLPKHNARYTVLASKEGNVHRGLTGVNLESIFCIKSKRVVQNDFTLQYKRRILQLEREQLAVIRPKESIIVSEHFDGTLSLSIRSIGLSFLELSIRPQKEQPAPKQWVPQKPATNHPWRIWNTSKPLSQNGGYCGNF